MSDRYDLVVIGAGPGGYVAAIRAAQLGLHVACVDANDALGGTCLRVGCIPSKALLESSARFYEARHGGLAAHGIEIGEAKLDLPKLLARKDKIVHQLTSGVAGLFKKNKVTRLQGWGRLLGDGKVEVRDADGGTHTVEATNILVATGSEPTSIPGVELDGDRIGTSTEALSYPEVPEHLIVIGAGVIGLEMGSVWARLGARVTLLEYLPTFLPGNDEEIAKMALRIFSKQNLKPTLGVKVTGAQVKGERVVVTYEEGDATQTIEGDRVLVATGRRPNTDGLGADEVGLQRDRRGFVQVDAHYRTNVPGIWAIGDVIPGPMLAHKAEEDGVVAAERMAGQKSHVDYNLVPGVVYTWPEVAGVGKTEEQLKEAGVDYKVGKFPFMANSRARAVGDTDGVVKVLADKRTDKVLGVHILGPLAGDILAECVAVMEFGGTAEDIARTCHSHPSMGESVKEAAMAADGRAIHI